MPRGLQTCWSYKSTVFLPFPRGNLAQIAGQQVFPESWTFEASFLQHGMRVEVNNSQYDILKEVGGVVVVSVSREYIYINKRA